MIIRQDSNNKLTLSGGISGTKGVQIEGNGKGQIAFTAPSTYEGNTVIKNSAVVSVSGTNILPTNFDVSLNEGANLLVDGNQNIRSLISESNLSSSLSSIQSVSGSSTSTLTLTNGGNYQGDLSGNLAIQVTGGTLTLGSQKKNSMEGNLIVSGGASITATAPNVVSQKETSRLIVDQATFNASGHSQTINNLQLNDQATFNAGDPNSSSPVNHTIKNLQSSYTTSSINGGTNRSTLTLTNGGEHKGTISGNLGINVTGGELALGSKGTNSNSMEGPMTISGNASLKAIAQNVTSTDTNSDLILQDQAVFNANGQSQKINSLILKNQATFITGDASQEIKNLQSQDTGTGIITAVTPFDPTKASEIPQPPCTLKVTKGSFAGLISGRSQLVVDGSLNLTNTTPHLYEGGTDIKDGGQLSLRGSASLPNKGAVNVDGTFDVQLIDSDTSIGSLHGKGKVLLGDKELLLNEDSNFSGSISGTDGKLTIKKGLNLSSQNNLSNQNTYSGKTNIEDGVLVANNNNVLSGQSVHELGEKAKIDLQTYSNQIDSLKGKGFVYGQENSELIIKNGGSFEGVFSKPGENSAMKLTLQGGVLELKGGDSQYTGQTSIASSATLKAGKDNVLSLKSSIEVTGVLDLQGYKNTVAMITGKGKIDTGSANPGQLTIANPNGTFEGNIVGEGGITITGGQNSFLTLAPAPSVPHTFQGDTSVEEGGTLNAGANDAFSKFSHMKVDGKLQNQSYKTSAFALSGSGTVDVGSGQLTITGSADNKSFSGSLIGNGGSLVIDNNGQFIAEGASSESSAPFKGQIKSGSLVVKTMITSEEPDPLRPTDLSQMSLAIEKSGQLDLGKEDLTLASLVTEGTILGKVTAVSDSNTIDESQTFSLTTTGPISLGGILNIDIGNAQEGAVRLFKSNSTDVNPIRNTFSQINITKSANNPKQPVISYGIKQVSLFFAGVKGEYISQGPNANLNWSAVKWQQNDDVKVPGIAGNTNDIADLTGPCSISLVNAQGTAPLTVTLQKLSLSGEPVELGGLKGSSLVMDSQSDNLLSQIIVAGSHKLDVPVSLNKSTEVQFTGKASSSLTFGSSAMVTSASGKTLKFAGRAKSNPAPDTPSLRLQQPLRDSALDSIVNDGDISPEQIEIASLKFTNNQLVTPSKRLSISNDVFVQNKGTNTGAIFAVSGPQGSMQIGQGAITNSPNIILENIGINSVMGATGFRGSVEVQQGVIQNKEGALLRAGDAGTLTLKGGSIINDRLSQVGGEKQQIVLEGGLLETTGVVKSFNYTQGKEATLKINLGAVPLLSGHVVATGAAQLDGTLQIQGTNTLATNTAYPILETQGGIQGKFNRVQYMQIPTNLIPSLIYAPDRLDVALSPILTPSHVGSLQKISLLNINTQQRRLQKHMREMHSSLASHQSAMNKEIQVPLFASNDDELLVKNVDTMSVSLDTDYRAYLTPIESFGRLAKASGDQVASKMNGAGVMAGIEKKFSSYALGIAADYMGLHGRLNHNKGSLKGDQLHGSLYGLFLLSDDSALSIQGSLGASQTWYHTDRLAGLPHAPVKVKSKTEGHGVDSLIGMEYLLSSANNCFLPSQITVTPYVNLQHNWQAVEGFKDENGGDYRLKVNHQSAHSLRSSLGTQISYEWHKGGVHFTPHINLGWQREFLDHEKELRVTAFQISDQHTHRQLIAGAGRNSFLGSMNVDMNFKETLEFQVSYLFEYNSSYTQHDLSFGLGVRF
ncbi:MAG: autotransporter domain-containing protein [Dolichospermum sp.]